MRGEQRNQGAGQEHQDREERTDEFGLMPVVAINQPPKPGIERGDHRQMQAVERGDRVAGRELRG